MKYWTYYSLGCMDVGISLTSFLVFFSGFNFFFLSFSHLGRLRAHGRGHARPPRMSGQPPLSLSCFMGLLCHFAAAVRLLCCHLEVLRMLICLSHLALGVVTPLII